MHGECSEEEYKQLMHDAEENQENQHYFLVNGSVVGGIVDVEKIKHLSYEDFNAYLGEHYHTQDDTFKTLSKEAQKQREETLLPKLFDGIIDYLEITGKTVDDLEGGDIGYLLDKYREDGGKEFKWYYKGNRWSEVRCITPESCDMLRREIKRREIKKHSISEIAEGITPRKGEMDAVLAETIDELTNNRGKASKGEITD